MVPEMQAEDFGRLRREMLHEKLRENQVMKAFYHLAVEDKNGKVDIKVVLLTHVDDVMWAAKPGYEKYCTQ